MTTGARLRPIPLMSAAGSRHPPVVAPRGERPGKNERPRTIRGTAPIRHHVAGLTCSSCTQIRLGDAAHTSVATSRWCLSCTRRWRMTWSCPPALRVWTPGRPAYVSVAQDTRGPLVPRLPRAGAPTWFPRPFRASPSGPLPRRDPACGDLW